MNLGRILGSEFDRPFTLMRDMLQSKVQPISLFVYYKGISERTWRLVGYQQVTEK